MEGGGSLLLIVYRNSEISSVDGWLRVSGDEHRPKREGGKVGEAIFYVFWYPIHDRLKKLSIARFLCFSSLLICIFFFFVFLFLSFLLFFSCKFSTDGGL